MNNPNEKPDGTEVAQLFADEDEAAAQAKGYMSLDEFAKTKAGKRAIRIYKKRKTNKYSCTR